MEHEHHHVETTTSQHDDEEEGSQQEHQPLEKLLRDGNYDEPFVDKITLNLQSSITELGDCLIRRIQEIYKAEKDQDEEERTEEQVLVEEDDESDVRVEETASGDDLNKVHNHISPPASSPSPSSSIFPLSPSSMEEITKLCKEKLERILHASQSQLIRIISTMHNKENEVRNHMRWHYDDKLKTCRMSHLLERRHESTKAQIDALDEGERMKDEYMAKIRQLESQLAQCEDMRRVQDNTLTECQQCLTKTQTGWKNTAEEFATYKQETDEKCAELESILNTKRKQEVWAHFKIMHLKEGLAKSEKLLAFKKKETKKLSAERKDLKSKLKVSVEIREGLERAFEKRAAIRGRLDAVHEEQSITTSSHHRTASRCSSTKSISTRPGTGCSMLRTHKLAEPRRKVKVKHQGLDAPPFYNDEISRLSCEIDDVEKRLETANLEHEKALRQNQAFNRLLSGQNLATILASKHRELSSDPGSLDAKLLYNLNGPSGELDEINGPRNSFVAEEVIPKKRKTATRSEEKSQSIPKTHDISAVFGGICGQQLETPIDQSILCKGMDTPKSIHVTST